MRTFVRTFYGLTFAIAIQFGAGSALAASFTVYTDLASWQAAAGSSVVQDFTDTTLIPGLTITFGTFLPGSIGGGVYTDEAVNNTGDTFSSGNPVMSYAPGTTAFGANWDLDALQKGLSLAAAYFYKVHFVGGGNQTTPVFIDTLQPGFVGFTSDTSFDQILMGTTFLDQETLVWTTPALQAHPSSHSPQPSLSRQWLSRIGFLSRRKRRQIAVAGVRVPPSSPQQT